jgi:hypothetical protein
MYQKLKKNPIIIYYRMYTLWPQNIHRSTKKFKNGLVMSLFQKQIILGNHLSLTMKYT